MSSIFFTPDSQLFSFGDELLKFTVYRLSILSDGWSAVFTGCFTKLYRLGADQPLDKRTQLSKHLNKIFKHTRF
jgi:hypothetical protein